MSTSFMPSDVIDMTKEKNWPANLGMLDWDNTNIIFTKRSLIEFLKYTGTTVDTNFTNVQKLPRYASFGTFSPPLDQLDAEAAASPSASPPIEQTDVFKPTRRVRTVPGGPHTDIFGNDFQDQEDALASAPQKESQQVETSEQLVSSVPAEEQEYGIPFTSTVKPSRRVRTEPGGKSSFGSFWGADPAPEEFKPTRRVRQGPGGQDNINDLF
ncbi:uncharacterized protein BT62DRAFT_925275 [Guyanagaster necrorhizus]|uniref:Uncharacterized protein n=1 Tax=Guyanagaster necrorhizus TaxID=856835 RepID=A0A9P8AYB9_9AGAR|nr:uncharacterized protein BT62DRAFT_925275 [Guyanagaster necrorhizus MCA 3950]KAG7452734.1 hypothetical protein BT62DRAFT_925275 [Guyanagaster necrorhizus MCA 3950]